MIGVRHSFEASARSCCTKYEVENGAKDAFIALGVGLDNKPAAFERIVLVRAYDEMYKAIEEVYKPRSPLEEQLEYIRARKEFLAETGIDMGAWQCDD